MESQKFKKAKIKMLHFGAEITKISNRKKYPLNDNIEISTFSYMMLPRPC